MTRFDTNRHGTSLILFDIALIWFWYHLILFDTILIYFLYIRDVPCRFVSNRVTSFYITRFLWQTASCLWCAVPCPTVSPQNRVGKTVLNRVDTRRYCVKRKLVSNSVETARNCVEPCRDTPGQCRIMSTTSTARTVSNRADRRYRRTVSNRVQKKQCLSLRAAPCQIM